MTGNNSIIELISIFREKMSRLGISAHTGLGTDLFHFVSSLTPIVNVDLLVYNTKGQFLLAMRDDKYYGKGWHVPGGCIRFKETIDSRIRKVAESELNMVDFSYDKEPIKVFEIIWNHNGRIIENGDERSHFITLVYKCYTSDSFTIDNQGKTETDIGYLQWFDKLPDDLLKIQNCYRDILI